MKRFNFLFFVVVVLLLGLFAMPLLAQDVPRAESTAAATEAIISGPELQTIVSAETSPIYYLVVVVLAVLLVAAFIFAGYITGALAKLVPPETAASIYQSGVRMGIELGLNQAARTPTALDDEFFIGLASQRGLEVSLVDGIYVVKQASPPVVNDSDLSWKNTRPANRDS